MRKNIFNKSSWITKGDVCLGWVCKENLHPGLNAGRNSWSKEFHIRLNDGKSSFIVPHCTDYPSLNAGFEYGGAGFWECHPSLPQVLSFFFVFLSQLHTFLSLTSALLPQNRHQNDCHTTEFRFPQQNRKETYCSILFPQMMQNFLQWIDLMFLVVLHFFSNMSCSIKFE